MRAFVALDLPDHIRAGLCSLQARLHWGRPLPAGNLHLTLLFLGEQPVHRLQMLQDQLAAIDAGRLTLGFDTLGSFGTPRPDVLFAAIADNPELERLQRQVAGAARMASIALPRRKFRPHVTLARGGSGAVEPLSGPAAAALPDFEIGSFSLFRSVLRPDGARHDRIAQYDLR